jgi:Mn-dependent DtxR family transcriptional regulator
MAAPYIKESGHVLTEKGEQLFRDVLSRHQE